jgi:hypothetical protein
MWIIGNVLLLGLIVAFWNEPKIAKVCTAGVLVVFNIAMVVRRAGSVGYPVSVATSSHLILRVVADSTYLGLLKVNPSSPSFVELEAEDIKGISGRETEIVWPGSKRTRGLWVHLSLSSTASEAMLHALGKFPKKPVRLGLFAPGEPTEFVLRWYATFNPPLREWLAALRQSWGIVDVEIQKTTLDLTGFAVMSDQDQKVAIRKLNALNFGPAALLLVRSAKKLSLEESDRFIKSAFE